jgi:3',5'-nucleoside bisphosphate phosphatase
VRRLRADLHVHTALSPCAADDMTPAAIVAAALACELDMIAVCDHNSTRNVRAVQGAAVGRPLTVLAGIEITSAEEVHVIGLFPTASAAAMVGDELRELLPETDGDYERFFGSQTLFGDDGACVGSEERALATATPLRLENVVALIKRYSGLAVAAHIDRPAFGVITQLGFFPYDAGFDGIELSRHAPPGSEKSAAAHEHHLPILRSSDAHFLDDVGAASTAVDAEEASFTELGLAMRARDGRSLDDA